MTAQNGTHVRTALRGPTRARRRLGSLGAVLACTVAISSGVASQAAAATDGTDPGAAAVGMGPLYYPYSPAAGNQASFPHVGLVDRVIDGWRVPQLWLSYSQGPDIGSADVNNGLLVSHDGGESFTDRRAVNMNTHAMRRTANGEIVSVQFIPRWTDSNQNAVQVRSFVSGNLGKTWSERLGSYTPPAGKQLAQSAFDRGFRVHKDLLQLPDGTLLTAAYGRYVGDPAWRSWIIQSTDNGRSWTERGTINTPTAGHGTSEVSFTRTRDGRLIAILRGAPEKDGLLQSYSTDDGRTWSTPVKLAAPTSTVDGAVEPSIVLQPNGMLVLAFGRPDNNLLISASGNGDDWSNPQQIFGNQPPDGYWTHGSSGNTSMVSVDSSRSVVFGDTCSPWGCQEYHEQYAVFARNIDAVTPGAGKLDVRTLLKEGTATISGTIGRTPKHFEQIRPNGAFDGSSDVFAATPLAAKKGRSELVLDLGAEYSLNRIGLMLAAGIPQDAQVQLSTDGASYTAPVVTATDRTDYSLRYTDFAPQRGRYVKVSAPAGGTLTAVTELELYRSDAETFENEVVGSVPRGWTNATGAAVADTAPSSTTPRTVGYHSERALRLVDHDPKAISRITRPFTARDEVTIGFQMTGINRQGGVIMVLRGSTADGQAATAHQLHFDVIGKKVNYYDGAKWVNVGVLDPQPQPGQWVGVSVTATPQRAAVTVGTQTFQVPVPREAVSTLNSFEFGSAGTAFTGSAYYFDDVIVR